MGVVIDDYVGVVIDAYVGVVIDGYVRVSYSMTEVCEHIYVRGYLALLNEFRRKIVFSFSF